MINYSIWILDYHENSKIIGGIDEEAVLKLQQELINNKNITIDGIGEIGGLFYIKIYEEETLEQKQAQETLKAVCCDIMFKKSVDLKELRKWIYAESENIVKSALKYYNRQVAPKEQLTEDEFETLKKGLKK